MQKTKLVLKVVSGKVSVSTYTSEAFKKLDAKGDFGSTRVSLEDFESDPATSSHGANYYVVVALPYKSTKKS